MATKKTESEAIVKEEKKAEPEVKAEQEERVMLMVPFIEGQDPEVTVIINGYVTKFRKGEMVSVPRNVAEVIQNSNQQMMAATANQKKFEKMVTEL